MSFLGIHIGLPTKKLKKKFITINGSQEAYYGRFGGTQNDIGPFGGF